ncbi:MAG: FtsH protease activity modulator HflK [Gammaproteobacteria bacterium]|nr:MAG: FtsH protease activity modulator HflK [Gammaproteobacteria bacterium]
MTQDNDPWGNDPRNTDGSSIGSILDKLKKGLLGGADKHSGSGRGGPGDDNSGDNNPRKQSGQGPGVKFPSLSNKAIAPIVVLALLGWGSTGVYILPEGFHGVELTFGRYTETAVQPGFNYRMPYPIGDVTKVDIGSLKNLSVGSRNGNTEGQMLTSDENIVEVSLSVQYKVGDAEKYLFNVNEPEKVLKETLISSIREVVGGSKVDYVLTDGRAEWPAKVRDNLVNTLKGFKVGFHIARVELRDAKAPKEVQEAFDDAVKAREDAERYKLQAEAYQNEKLPLARGKAKAILEQAEGDKASFIAQATGEANRFDALLTSYQMAPNVTRDRMYIETLQNVYQKVNNVVVATGKNAPLLYLPVNGGMANTNTMPPVLPTGEENPKADDKKQVESSGTGQDNLPKIDIFRSRNNKELTR